MTEEQIKQNALAYATENYGEYNEHDYTDHSGSNMCHAVSEKAFIAGAKCVVEHHKSPWINVNEKLPEKKYGKIRSDILLVTLGQSWTVVEYHFGDKQLINLPGERETIEPEYWKEVNLPD